MHAVVIVNVRERWRGVGARQTTSTDHCHPFLLQYSGGGHAINMSLDAWGGGGGRC